MRQQKAPEEKVGIKAIQLLRQGRNKDEVKEELSLPEYTYRGILAAHKRGAYREALHQTAQPARTYIDSHGVVHTSKVSIADVENGYK
jgi:hypothetical protein